MSQPMERVFVRRVGFPYFFLAFFLFASAFVPWLVTNYAKRTVPGGMMSWAIVTLITGALLIYGLLQWRKVIRFEIRADGVAFSTLSSSALQVIRFAEIATFEYHPASQAQDAMVIVLQKNAGQSFWKSSDNPVLTEPYGIRMRDLQRQAQIALEDYRARNT